MQSVWYVLFPSVKGTTTDSVTLWHLKQRISHIKDTNDMSNLLSDETLNPPTNFEVGGATHADCDREEIHADSHISGIEASSCFND
jgi:hypothetical protein